MKELCIYCCTIVFAFSTYAGINRTSYFESLPNGFIENKGQVKDQYGKVNEDVKFIYSNKLFHFHLKNEGFSYEFVRVINNPLQFPESGKEVKQLDDYDESNNHFQISTARVDVVLKGANSFFKINGREQSDVYYNFYLNTLPSSGIDSVRSFNEVVYENVYPGIDMVFTVTTNKQALKYEFIVHPGADPKQIQLEYHGMSNIEIDNLGNLEIRNRLGEVREVGLYCYQMQSKEAIPCKLLLKGNTVSFNLHAIKNQIIVIDPNIVWGTYYGGEMAEDVYPEIALSKSDNVILTGVTESLTSIATSGSYQTTFSGKTDAILAKFDIDGKIAWATYFGGAGVDISGGVVIDKENNIIISGDTESMTGIATTGSYQQTNAGGYDAFIAKFSPSGTIIWSTYFGASEKDQLRDVTCDTAGNIYATGITRSASGIATQGAYQEIYAGLRDILVAKFSGSGALQWATYYGGEDEDRPHGITTDVQGNIFIEGTVESSTGIASANAFQAQYGEHTDACLAKFDSGGQLLWGTYYGGINEDHGRKPVTDASGNVYIMGFTQGNTGLSTTGSFQETNGGDNDGFIAKFSPSGNRLWGSYYGGIRGEQLESIAIDELANIYLCGKGTSDSLNTPEAFQNQVSDTIFGDGLLLKMDSSGERIWATYFGGYGKEKIYDIAIDSAGFIYFVLYDSSSVIPISPWVSQTHNNGISDWAVYKFFQEESCYDYNEPNDSWASARLIETVPDSSLYGYNGSISSPTDIDWYQVNIEPDSPNLKIRLSDLTKNYDLKLFDPQGQLIQESNNPGTADETIILNGALQYNYYFSIEHTSLEFDSLNCYQLLALRSVSPFTLYDNIFEENHNPELIVGPNPATNQVQISFTPNIKGEANITIYNILRQPVKFKSLYMAEGNCSAFIDLVDLSSGSYLLELKQGEQILTKKLMILK